MPFWSLATSAPNREAWISFVLSGLEIEHRIFYVRIANTIKPIFPGYVFVNADNFELVKRVTGILGFVKVNGETIDVTHVVEKLEAEGRGTNVLRREHVIHSRFQHGDLVQVTGLHHLMCDKIGQFQHRLASGKAAVLMGSLRVVVDEKELEPVAVTCHRSRNRRTRVRTRRSVRAVELAPAHGGCTTA